MDFNISNLLASDSLALNRPAPTLPMSSISPSSFDVSKNIVLVTPFRESEVDTYFNVIEPVAASLHWPK